MLGRVVEITLPDDNTIQNEYGIENGVFKTVVTDPNNKSKESYSDVRENIIEIRQFNNSKTISTKYEYNLLNEITKVIDTLGNTTSITYDSLGRRTSIDNPDKGFIEYLYDKSGNLIKKLDGNLRNMANGILYEYDYNRLKRIVYPKSEPITYEYGAPGAAQNAAGRLTKTTDDSGMTQFVYGSLGEQISVTKTMNRLTSGADALTFQSEYGYDYLGRIQWIKYPDDEIVTYEYDEGGQIKSVFGMHKGERFDYIKDICYDEFGQRAYIKYGNDVETRYSYDENRRWLSNIKTQKSSTLSTLQDINYTFDGVGNILSINNTAGVKEVVQSFGYDDIYQLTSAEGTYTDRTINVLPKTNQYTQNYVYDDIGNMMNKTSFNKLGPSTKYPEKLNYNFNYTYSETHPHRAVHIHDWYYKYDANGNLIERSTTPIAQEDETQVGTLNGEIEEKENTDYVAEAYGRKRKDPEGSDGYTYKWNEENRLIEATVNSNTTYFLYNAAGERTVKKGEYGENLYIDKMYQLKTTTDPMLTTKHIFVGTTRMVSKLSHQELGVIDNDYARTNTYYYHPDHLGSSNVITDYEANEYEHMLFTPYGETWVEEGDQQELLLNKITFKYTSKEIDEETNLYYFGARYLDPRTSRWISCDPAFEEYLSGKPSGGVYNPTNLNLYHYASNNPVKYIDPTGEFPVLAVFLIGVAVVGIIGTQVNRDQGKYIDPLIQSDNQAKYGLECMKFSSANEVISDNKVKNEVTRVELMDDLKEAKYSMNDVKDILNESLHDSEMNYQVLTAEQAKGKILNNELGDDKMILQFEQNDYWGSKKDGSERKGYHWTGFAGLSKNKSDLKTKDPWNGKTYTNKGQLNEIKKAIVIKSKGGQ